MGCPIRSCDARHAARGPRPAGGHATKRRPRSRIALRPDGRHPRSESGFTLAGLLVILTIIAIFIAYTVPPQWSKIMQRDREKQTIFVMKQYARAIKEWSKKNGANPVKIDQLKEARSPRVIRGVKGEWIDPLTGKVDWILIPPGAVTQGAGGIPGLTGTQGGGAGPAATTPAAGSTTTSGTGATTSTAPQNGVTQFNAAASPRDYVGPFVGVRPPVTGQAILSFQNATDYSGWYYTTMDLDLDVQKATMPNPNAH